MIFGNPYINKTKPLINKLLSLSVIGLGAGINLNTVAKVGLQGAGYTVLSILFTSLIAFFLYKGLNTKKDVSLLVVAGTAICGGSAIAAVAPTIRAKHNDISVALGVVFILNAIALFVFPQVGHFFNLSQEQFGLWSALSIHDTSSVVGATLEYGPRALEVGTTVKLARALWIVPIVVLISFVKKFTSRSLSNEKEASKVKKPYFIIGFLFLAALVTWFPALEEVGLLIESISKRLMVVTLFLIGSTLTKDTIRNVGLKPLLYAIILWGITASFSLYVIFNDWIRV